MNLKAGETLKIVTSGGADCDVHASWRSRGNNGQSMPGSLNTQITTATTTEVAAGPSDTTSTVREIETLSIRNVDTSSNTVTIKHTDAAGTAVELKKSVIAAGGEVMYDINRGWTSATQTPAGATLITLAAPITNADASANTLADVTGLAFAVTSGYTYRFRALIPYTSAATTTGSRWTINGPTVTSLSYKSVYTIDATSQTTNFATAIQIPAAANATSLTTGNVATIEGVIKPSADGTVQVQFASEVSASAVVALAGATLEWQLLLTA